jgi:hypothetical protein
VPLDRYKVSTPISFYPFFENLQIIVFMLHFEYSRFCGGFYLVPMLLTVLGLNKAHLGTMYSKKFYMILKSEGVESPKYNFDNHNRYTFYLKLELGVICRCT